MTQIWRRLLVAALAAGALTAGGCTSSPHCPQNALCPSAAPRVLFVPAINGKPATPRRDGHVSSYRVRTGEFLVMRVAVTVPEHVRVTALWFGISSGTWGNGPEGPSGMQPVLAHYREPLSAGTHTFGLRWHIPQRRAGASLYLVFAWSSQQPPASVPGPVARLILS